MRPIKMVTHVFDTPMYRVSYDSELEAINNSSKYPPFLFKRKGNTYEANHSDYVHWLNLQEKQDVHI